MENRKSCLESTIKKLTANFPTSYEMLAIGYGLVIYPQIWVVKQTYDIISRFSL